MMERTSFRWGIWSEPTKHAAYIIYIHIYQSGELSFVPYVKLGTQRGCKMLLIDV